MHEGVLMMLDILVAGGGYVGLATAAAIKQAAPHLSVEVIEAAPENVWRKDPRASAIIAAATRRGRLRQRHGPLMPAPCAKLRHKGRGA